jgi:hypothetical protein
MFLDPIDWERPWLAPLRPAAASIIKSLDWRGALNSASAERMLGNHRGLPIQFVPQTDLPANMAYESFISMTGCVPTRDNLHDFFNALVWLTFPKAKAKLNALQASEIERLGVADGCPNRRSGGRGRLRDAATLFDENAALLIVRDGALLDALRQHKWTDAFMERRGAFGRSCEVWLFGHALIEKLVHPYKAITAHAWAIEADDFFTLPACEKKDWLDMVMAGQLSPRLVSSDFTPLPILGVPGWCAAQDARFYEDTSVFRPLRQTR